MMSKTLDHLVLCVTELEQAQAHYRSLGFTLTPRATMPFGTCNSLIQMPGLNFLELLALDGRAVPAHELPQRFSFGAHNQDFLRQHGEGMSMLVFAGSDASADVEAFRRAGLVTYEPFDFGREATLPDGQVVQVAFSCHQRHTPELFWKPEYQKHVNGAERLVEVVMSAPEPAALGGFLCRLTGGEVAVDDDGSGIRIGPISDRISVLNPARTCKRFPELDGEAWIGSEYAPRFIGYRVVVADLNAVRDLLDQTSILHRVTASSIVVAPSVGHSMIVEFSE